MDYTNVRSVDINVQDCIAAGLASHSRMRPQPHVRAAYVADDPQMFGFMRMLEGVCNSHVDVRSCRHLPAALDWLGATAAEARADAHIG